MRTILMLILVLFIFGCESKSDDNASVEVQSNFDDVVQIEYKVKYDVEFLFDGLVVNTKYKTECINTNPYHEKWFTMSPDHSVSVKYNGLTREYEIENSKVLISILDFGAPSG